MIYLWVARPSMPSSTTSFCFKSNDAFPPRPTPAGVPVEISAPGKSDIKPLRYLTMNGRSKMTLQV